MDTFPKIPGYRFENKFGQGRLADVYQAVKESTGQNVVIKVLLPELIQAEDSQFPQRFIQEAQKAGQLDHPNIVKIIDAGVINDNYYFVMEYMPENLRMKIVNMYLSSGFDSGQIGSHQNGNGMPANDTAELIDMFKQVLDALDYAHQQEIIHGDIRPENIFLKSDAVFITPVIVDFCVQPVVLTSSVLHERGLVVRDPHYTCPENILKIPTDNTCDYYNLGIVFFEMLTGHVPYDAEDKYTLEKLHVEAPIPQLPPHLSQFQPLLNSMMAKDSSERPKSAAELILMLEEFKDDALPEVNGDGEPNEEEPYELAEEIPTLNEGSDGDVPAPQAPSFELEEVIPPFDIKSNQNAPASSFGLEEEISPAIESSNGSTVDYGEIENDDAELNFTANDNIKTSMEPGLGQEIEITSDFEEKSHDFEKPVSESSEIGEEFRKEMKGQLSKEVNHPGSPNYSASEKEPRHPFETGMRSPTLAADDSDGFLAKLKNPRVFIPAAAGIIIIVALAVIFLLPGSKSTPTPDQAQEQEITGDTGNVDGSTNESSEKQYTRNLKQAQRSFEAGDYEKALLQITEAQKIKNTPESEALKKQIDEASTTKLDDKMYQTALKTGTAASLEEYLNKYPSGQHATEAREKMDELNQSERKRIEERRKWAASRVVLRSTPQTLAKEAVKEMVKKRGFFEKYYNNTGNFANHYELETINSQKVVNDYATGLMWHHSGSLEYMKYEKIQSWLDELNSQKYAGFSDWRLPTLEEAASLLESQENNNALYIDAIFSKDQNHIWTADKYSEIKAWAIDIFGGDFNPIATGYDSFVRPVRTMK